MLTILSTYAAAGNLPYEFVGWALDTYGHDTDNYGNLDTVAHEWRRTECDPDMPYDCATHVCNHYPSVAYRESYAA